METIVAEGNVDDRNTATTQIQIQSGSGETQMVTLPVTMAHAINSAQGQQTIISANQAGQPVAQDTAKRRELLSRRPSYRKILNELSGQPDTNQRVKDEPGGSKSSESSESDSGGQMVTPLQPPTLAYQTGSGTVTVHQPQTLQIPASALNHDQHVTSVAGLQTFSMANALAQGQATLVQDSNAGGNALWMPGNHVVVQGDSQMYQIRTSSSSNAIPNVVLSGNSMQSPQQMAEEASRKRELRLMKNREAAKDCRLKKKEYIKCLENRVHVLETQNKALIDELQQLKEMYCRDDLH
uniref:BZIP domain-containing protein n=1 Tax=Ciona savignyi TaxID=51511 RepID=H2YWJ7_CIOSA